MASVNLLYKRHNRALYVKTIEQWIIQTSINLFHVSNTKYIWYYCHGNRDYTCIQICSASQYVVLRVSIFISFDQQHRYFECNLSKSLNQMVVLIFFAFHSSIDVKYMKMLGFIPKVEINVWWRSKFS